MGYHSHSTQRGQRSLPAGRQGFSRGRSFGRPAFRPQRQSRGNQKGQEIHFSKFINKGVEEAEMVVFVPKHKFADFDIDARIKSNIARKGYVTPTPIQDQAIPHVLTGRDVVGLADTGTGKTGAFLIPLLDKVVKQREQRVLIIVPTRELAVQIDEELKGFAHGSGFRSVVAVGGVNINPQIRGMREDPHFVIATPGRLKDLFEQKVVNLSKYQNVVLDEADRMLDMGFIRDIQYLLSFTPKQRHTLFFSATLSREIESLIHQFLNDPIRISIKTRDTAATVDQDIIRIEGGKNKLDVLHDLLIQPEFNKVLIFGRTKHGVERLMKNLAARGFKAESIHGNKNQSKRQRALSLFKASHVQVLVATDVAARGIDIDGVSHVINFDLPTTYDDYVHRIGRTGRAGKRGKALTFIE